MPSLTLAYVYIDCLFISPFQHSMITNIIKFRECKVDCTKVFTCWNVTRRERRSGGEGVASQRLVTGQHTGGKSIRDLWVNNTMYHPTHRHAYHDTMTQVWSLSLCHHHYFERITQARHTHNLDTWHWVTIKYIYYQPYGHWTT